MSEALLLQSAREVASATSQPKTRVTESGVGQPLKPKIVVIIPCYNEEMGVGRVVADFRCQLPEAEIHVCDNNSSDRTVEAALHAGASISHEMRRGKGNVVRSLFRRVDGDIYIMVDGDCTYPADKIHELLAPILRGEADMVVGSRMISGESEMRIQNRLGNVLFRVALNSIFRCHLTDILSGYRVMTRDFVRSIVLLSDGFQIETELTIQALNQRMRIIEVPVALTDRPPGSHSKICIMADGFKILWTILDLFRTYKPLTVFGGAGLSMVGLGLILGMTVVVEFLSTGLVPRLPTAMLASGMVLSGLLSLCVGLILNTLIRNFKELHYKITALDQRLHENE